MYTHDLIGLDGLDSGTSFLIGLDSIHCITYQIISFYHFTVTGSGNSLWLHLNLLWGTGIRWLSSLWTDDLSVHLHFNRKIFKHLDKLTSMLKKTIKSKKDAFHPYLAEGTTPKKQKRSRKYRQAGVGRGISFYLVHLSNPLPTRDTEQYPVR